MTTDALKDVAHEVDVEGFITRDKRAHVAGLVAVPTTPSTVPVPATYKLGIDLGYSAQ